MANGSVACGTVGHPPQGRQLNLRRTLQVFDRGSTAAHTLTPGRLQAQRLEVFRSSSMPPSGVPPVPPSQPGREVFRQLDDLRCPPPLLLGAAPSLAVACVYQGRLHAWLQNAGSSAAEAAGGVLSAA